MQSVVRLYLGIIVATAFPCAARLPAQAVLAESGGESNDEGLGASVGFAGDVDRPPHPGFIYFRHRHCSKNLNAKTRSGKDAKFLRSFARNHGP